MTDDATVLAELERRRYDAMRDSDHAALAQLCDDELTYTHSDGTSDTKDTYLQRIRDGYFDYQRLEHETYRTLVVGDCALVFGRMSGEVLISGALRQLNSASLVVWARRADGWRFLAFQPTPLR
ncbi:MAG TPA: nuclear transport factor 2 family protein [Jatrophihabitans sp.]|nr:nuclear transport factor 2 family protein [Jatrophihabitans sp.]